MALFLGDVAPDAGDVGFLGVAFFKLQAEVALRMGRAGEDHDAGGVHIQAVHQERFGEGGLQAGDQAIGQMLSLAGDREEAGGLVNQKQLVVFVDDIQWGIGRRIGEIGVQGRLPRSQDIKDIQGNKRDGEGKQDAAFDPVFGAGKPVFRLGNEVAG